MKKYSKEKLKKKSKQAPQLSKLGFRILAVISALLIVGVGLLCTSPSKAADEAPYFPPDIDTDEIITEEETAELETEPATEAQTLIEFETGDVTYEETEPDTDTTEAGTEEITTEPVTTEPVTTEPVTTEPVTEPPATETEKAEPKDPAGKQSYHEYNGREYGENESFVGEYKTDRVSIGVSNVRYGDVSYYICDIKVKSVKDLHTAFANNSISGRAYTSKIAQSVGAGFAVNGDFCGYRASGIIIREGGLYRNKRSDNWDLCYINKYGDLITCKNDKEDGKALVNGGVWQSWCFGPTLVENYRALSNSELNTPDLSRKDWAREPRTVIAQIDELHYMIIVVDVKRVPNGLGGWNTVGGMNFDELAATCASLGCKTAYNLDGGGSTTLYLNGKVVNEPSGGGERQISDIIYFK